MRHRTRRPDPRRARSPRLPTLIAAAVTMLLVVTLAPVLPATAAPVADAPQVVPTLREWNPKQGREFSFTGRVSIEGDLAELGTVAETLSSDLQQLTRHQVRLNRSEPRVGDIVLRQAPDAELGQEGYALDVDGSLTITGPTAHGVFNGTRSVLQLLKGSGRIPAGTARDWPTKAVRSVLVDNTPRHFSRDWWESFFRQMSWFKLNDTNLYIDGAGLDEREWKQIDELSRRYYVKVVPQLNMPGHMHAVLPSHPEYQLKNADGTTNPVALDLTNEEAVDWALGLIDQYAPLFSSDTWHLGSDEFPGWPGTGGDHPQLDAYAKQKFGPQASFWDLFADFQNRANKVVKSHGKKMRVWNDMVRDSKVVRLDPDVAVEYWIQHPDLPGLLTSAQLAERGHEVINADVDLLYYDMSKRNLDPRDLYEKFDVDTFTAGQKPNPAKVSGARIAVWLAWINTPMESDAEVLSNLRMDMAGLSQHSWADGPVTDWKSFSGLVERLGRAPGHRGSGNRIAGDPSVATNPDGTLAWFARDADGTLWGGRQHDPGSGPWSRVKLADGIAGDPRSLVDREGRVHVLARTAAGGIVHAAQRQPGSDDYQVQTTGDDIAGEPAGFSTEKGIGWAARTTGGELAVQSPGGEVARHGSGITGDPGAVTSGVQTHLLVSTESESLHLWGDGQQWQQATTPGRLTSTPVLLDRRGTAVAATTANGGNLVSADLGNGPVAWTTVREGVVGQPDGVVDGQGAVHLAVRSNDGNVAHAHSIGQSWKSKIAWFDFDDDPAIGIERGKVGPDVPTIIGQNNRGFLAVTQPSTSSIDGPWTYAHLAESTTGTPAVAKDSQGRATYLATTDYGDLQTGTRWGGINDWGRDFVVGTINYPGDDLVPEQLPRQLHADDFSADTTAGYEVLQPTGRPAPAPTIRDGRLQVSGEDYLTILRSKAALPATGDVSSSVTIGDFADTTGAENSLHVGFVADNRTRVGAWYNRSSGRLGFDTFVDGVHTEGWGDVPLQLVPGDKLAVTLSGRWMTAYRFHDGQWDRIHASQVSGAQDLADPAVRATYRAGFGMSATAGTIAVDDVEVRGRD